ncbi:MAG: AAA family ATPase [Chitinophagales bacterium]
MRIENIHLKNVGVFEDEKIDFQIIEVKNKAEIHIFTGENGSGKSTLLYALADFFEYPKFLHDRFRINGENPPKGQVKLKHSLGTATLTQQTDKQHIGLTGDKTHFDFFDNLYSDLDIPQHCLLFAYSGVRSLSSQNISSIEEISEDPFTNILDFQKSVNSTTLLQWVVNNKAKASLSDNGKYSQNIQLIENIIEEIIGKSIQFVLEIEPTFHLRVRMDGILLPINVLPDGLKSIISWIADLIMRMDRIPWAYNTPILDRNFILFLDEIDIHLHPSWQRKILPVVQKMFKYAQIFVSTHSPFVVNSIDDAWVYQLKVENGNTKVTQVFRSETGNSYSAVLQEIFEVHKRFGEETEEDLAAFQELRNKILKNEVIDEKKFNQLAHKLIGESQEVSNIIGRELRQIKRITNKEFAV